MANKKFTKKQLEAIKVKLRNFETVYVSAMTRTKEDRLASLLLNTYSIDIYISERITAQLPNGETIRILKIENDDIPF